MALINCSDCGTEVSDSAATCAECGAPIPQVLGPDEAQCPWCMAVVHKDATLCPGCQAMKGYGRNNHGVIGKGSMIAFGIVLTGVIAIAAFPYFWPISAVFAVLALLCTCRVAKGPLWYQRKDR